MKTNASKTKTNGSISAEAIVARAAAAKKFADLARRRLKAIKAEHKMARKAFKQAKKVAKRARKEAKVVTKALEAKAARAAQAAKSKSITVKPAKAPQPKARAAATRPVVTKLPTTPVSVPLMPASATHPPAARREVAGL
jgi:hypothetical protein